MKQLNKMFYGGREFLRICAARGRAHAASWQGVKIAPKCLLGRGVRLDRPWTITLGCRCVLEPWVWFNVVADEARVAVGDHVFIGRGAEIGVIQSVVIGRNTLISPGVFITDHNHGLRSGLSINIQMCVPEPVVIGDDVWIGAHGVILPGVTIGSGAVVGAGAVVTRSVDQGSIVAGVPAKVIGMREPGNLA